MGRTGYAVHKVQLRRPRLTTGLPPQLRPSRRIRRVVGRDLACRGPRRAPRALPLIGCKRAQLTPPRLHRVIRILHHHQHIAETEVVGGRRREGKLHARKDTAEQIANVALRSMKRDALAREAATRRCTATC